MAAQSIPKAGSGSGSRRRRRTMRPAPPLLVFLLLLARLPRAASSTAAGTETLIGIVGRDFVLLGADSSVSRSIAVTAANLDKIAVVVDPFPGGEEAADDRDGDPHRQQCVVAAAAGDAADADRLLGLLRAHAALREYEAGVGCDVAFVRCGSGSGSGSGNVPPAAPGSAPPPRGLSAADVAHLARGLIAQRMRSPRPLQVCLLVAGMVAAESPVDDEVAVPPACPFVWRPAPVASEYGGDSAESGGDAPPACSNLQQQVRRASAALRAEGGTAAEASPQSPGGGGGGGDGMAAAPLRLRQPPSSPLRPRLFWLDEYGSFADASSSYAVHGLGSHFAWSVLDRSYRTDLTVPEALGLMRDCFEQLRTRYAVNAPNPPCVKLVDRRGCHLVALPLDEAVDGGVVADAEAATTMADSPPS